jgi:hypothetical protein
MSEGRDANLMKKLKNDLVEKQREKDMFWQ